MRETIKEPTAIKMRANLAKDAREGRYTAEILKAIMLALDPPTYEQSTA